jgi:hypothetical protein
MAKIMTKSVENRKAILKWLLAKGFKWHGDSNLTPDVIERKWSYKDYPVLEITMMERYICGNYSTATVTHTSIVELSNDIDNYIGNYVVRNYE